MAAAARSFKETDIDVLFIFPFGYTTGMCVAPVAIAVSVPIRLLNAHEGSTYAYASADTATYLHHEGVCCTPEYAGETVVWQDAPANSRAVRSRGIAEAVAAEKSVQSHIREGGVYDKTASEGHGQPLRDSRWGRGNPAPSLWTEPKTKSSVESLDECIVRGCWEPEWEFVLTVTYRQEENRRGLGRSAQEMKGRK